MKRAQRAVPVVGLMGLPGAGKSRLARHLAGELNWSVLDRDRLRQERFPDTASDRKSRQVAEAIMADRLASMLRRGQPAILDGMTLARQAARDRWAALSQREGGDWRVLYLACSRNTAVARVEADRRAGRHPATDRNANLVDAVAARLELPGSAEPALTVHAPLDLPAILRWLRQPPATDIDRRG